MEDGEDTRTQRKSVGYNMAQLVHERINSVLQICDGAGIKAKASPSFDTLNHYAAALRQLYLTVYPLIPEDQRENIEEVQSNYRQAYSELLHKRKAELYLEVVNVLDNLYALLTVLMTEAGLLFMIKVPKDGFKNIRKRLKELSKVSFRK